MKFNQPNEGQLELELAYADADVLDIARPLVVLRPRNNGIEAKWDMTRACWFPDWANVLQHVFHANHIDRIRPRVRP